MPGVAAPESLLIPVTTADKTMKTTTMMIVRMIFVLFSMIEVFYVDYCCLCRKNTSTQNALHTFTRLANPPIHEAR